MIINVGQRTDIPAFYSKWFINRIREGFVMVRNPYYPQLVSKFSLDPKVVDIICFGSKNPHPMIQYLDELKDYKLLWHITITGFKKDVEVNVPNIDDVIKDFITISNKLGKQSVIWRYTPIYTNEKYTIEYHIKAFSYIAEKLKGYTNVAIFGFIDLYDKLKRIHPEIMDCRDEDKVLICQEFLKIAKRNDMELRLCSKEKWLEEYGVDINGCIRISDYEKVIGEKLIIKQSTSGRKNYCSCYLANDIGAYNSCLHFCKYCYANDIPEKVKANYCLHDDNSPFLIGKSNVDDIVKEINQISNKDLQVRLF